MKSTLVHAATLCALLALPVLAQEKPKQEKIASVGAEKSGLKLGAVVDESLVLTDIDGKTTTFKDLRGKVVAIHFWSTQCPYEVVADPKVQKLEERWKDRKDVIVLAINSNVSEIGSTPPSDGYAAIREHMKKKGLTNRVIADHGNKLADLFQARHTPHCFVLDREGKLVYVGGLDDDPKGDKGEATQQYLRDAVEAALAGKEPAVKESKPYGCSIKRVKA